MRIIFVVALVALAGLAGYSIGPHRADAAPAGQTAAPLAARVGVLERRLNTTYGTLRDLCSFFARADVGISDEPAVIGTGSSLFWNLKIVCQHMR